MTWDFLAFPEIRSHHRLTRNDETCRPTNSDEAILDICLASVSLMQASLRGAASICLLGISTETVFRNRGGLRASAWTRFFSVSRWADNELSDATIDLSALLSWEHSAPDLP